MKSVAEAEKKLEEVLSELKLSKKVTASDIKDIIWNEKDHNDFTRLLSCLIGKESNLQKINKVTGILLDAWNTFPHKSLGGLSPKEKIEKHPKYKETTAPKELPKSQLSHQKKKIQDVFAEMYPPQTRFVKIGKVEWGFEFPKEYFDLSEKLWELEESDISAEEYEKTLKQLLFLMPEFFDAANSLAQFYEYNDKLKNAAKIYELTIRKGRSFIPSSFLPGKHKLIWAWMDNRPFLRLLANSAMFVEKTQGVLKAIPLYEGLLQLNPNDNQGIRSLLATDYLKTDRLHEILTLASKYPYDSTPQIAMGKVLALLKLGDIESAKKHLKKIKRYQMHVIKELLKLSHPKPKNLMEDRVTVGGEDEAYYYWEDQGNLWVATKGAIDFLRDFNETK